MRGVELVPALAAVERGGSLQQLKPGEIGRCDLHRHCGAGVHGPVIENDAVVADPLGRDQRAAGHPWRHRNGIHIVEVEQHWH